MTTPTDLICFSHLRWGFVFQRPNHLMARFARQQRTFFVEEPRIEAGLSTPRMAVERDPHGPMVCVPHLPPGMSAAESEHTQRGLLRELVRAAEIQPQVLWFYTPMALPIAEGLTAPLIVYDCMDELSAFRGAPPQLVERERRLFARADLVLTGGYSLYEAKRSQHPRVHPVPSSVDAEHFAQARAPRPAPLAQRSIPRPRLGFFGVIDERMDLGLIDAVAELRPDWHIVMIGPVVKIELEDLPQRPNLHWLGGRPYSELPAYLAGWDVAIMPFARNASTEFISPTKTLEYLAAGKPVVSTSIRDVVQPYGNEGLVRIADDPEGFVEAVAAALAEEPTRRRAAADAFVARTSWDATWSRVHGLMQQALAARLGRSAPEFAPEKEETTCTTI